MATTTPFCEHGMLRTRCKRCNPGLAQKQRHTSVDPSTFLFNRNIAFKCNWLDTDYEGPCGKAGRRWNIHIKKFPWCTQPENPCYQYEMGLKKEVPPYPCYETEIFSKYEYGAGVNHRGPRKGIGRRIRYLLPGKIALFTTVDPGETGEARYIFGFFIIKGDYIDSHYGATKIVGYPEYTLKIPQECRLRFWDFYMNRDGSTAWGTGLYRYLTDEQVISYLNAQIDELKREGYEDEALLAERVLERIRQ